MTTQVIVASEDAYVQSDTPTTVYNTTGLWARSGSLIQHAYLKFPLPAAPAGEILSTAVLKIRTQTGGGGAAGAQNVHLITGTWDEATVTYNTRPTQGTQIGTLAGPSAADTVYNITLTAAEVEAFINGTLQIGFYNAGADDGFGFWSSEHAASTYRPELTLTYVPGVTEGTETPVAAATLSGITGGDGGPYTIVGASQTGGTSIGTLSWSGLTVWGAALNVDEVTLSVTLEDGSSNQGTQTVTIPAPASGGGNYGTYDPAADGGAGAYV